MSFLENMAGSPGPNSSSLTMEFGEIDWKERCLALEAQMNKFKTQASKIRDVLSEKMQELEQSVKEANMRAEKAEQQVKVVEEQLAAEHKPSAITSQDDDLSGKLKSLQKSCDEKDEQIHNLELQVEEQRKLRLQESKLVETKAAKIKEWVTSKLEELEQENQQLRQTNKEHTETINKLQDKLEQYGEKSTYRAVPATVVPRPISVDSLQSMELEPQGVPERPSSLAMSELDTNFRDRGDHDVDLPDTQASVPWSPVHALILAQESKIKSDSGIPRSKSESQTSSNNTDVEQGCKKGHTWPKRRVLNKNEELEVFQGDNPHNSAGIEKANSGSVDDKSCQDMNNRDSFIEPLYASLRKNTGSSFQHKLTNSKPDNIGPLSVQTTSTSPDTEDASSSDNSMSRIDSDLYAVPRKCRQQSPSPTGKAVYKPMAGDIDDETGEPPLVPNRMSDIGINSIIVDDEQQVLELDSKLMEEKTKTKPPTPPHRLPSWEDRILSIAASGMRISQDSLPIVITDSDVAVYQTSEVNHTNQLYQEMKVPVYSLMKGRAVQVRSSPYSGGDSSDSENDDSSGTSSTMIQSPSAVSMATSSTSPKKSGDRPSTAVKRGVSMQSTGSEGDYCIPPDAATGNDGAAFEEPEQKLLKTSQPDSPTKLDIGEKSGYLTKLGGKVKSWKKRWFVLQNGQLMYYKSKNDTSGKPLGQILLDGKCKVVKSDSSHCFELATPQRTYYLTAESHQAVEEWLQALTFTLRFQIDGLDTDGRNILKGWLTKIKHGHQRKCWCTLIGKNFTSYKTPTDKVPLETVDVQNARFEEADASDSDAANHIKHAKFHFMIQLPKKTQETIYLTFSSKEEKEKWLYHLTLASTASSNNANTEFEVLITKLMEEDGDVACPLWKHPTLCYSKGSLDKPLTTLPSEGLKKEALKMFKTCQLFIGVPMDSQSIDYHVTLAQNILQMCMTHPVLQSELYCHLIKQTTKRPKNMNMANVQNLFCGGSSWFGCDVSSTSTSMSSTDQSIDALRTPPHTVFLQGWQLLGLCTTLFLPKQKYLWFLKTHLQRHADPRNEIGKYAVFCQRSLERTTHCGGRESRPSRMEVLSILLRNPYHHSLPISIPVHLLNGTYEVVGFDGQTTVREFIQTLNQQIGMRDVKYSGFAIFTNDPASKDIEHCLQLNIKLCDVISKWEKVVTDQGLTAAKSDSHKTIRLVYKNRLYLKGNSKLETDKEKLLLAYQLHEHILAGRYAVSKEVMLELTSLMCQIEYGDYKPASKNSVILDKFCPKRYKDVPIEKKITLEHKLITKWSGLTGRSLSECARLYLAVARKWPFFGAQLFVAKCKYGNHNQVWVAVSDEGVSLLDYNSMELLESHAYKSIVTFGGCRDDFMVVISKGEEAKTSTVKLVFSMSTPKVLEITVLMANYINAI
ncbi:pleckstrin homology domain-containing family H member 1-like [Glandiceps talaboti]